MITATPGGVRLSLHVHPGAKRSAVIGVHGDALKIAVLAPPADGKANEAVVALIAEAFQVPPRAVSLISGHSSRRKVIKIHGLTVFLAEQALQSLVGWCLVRFPFHSHATMSEDLSFPIGKFRRPASLTDFEFGEAVETLAKQPAALRASVRDLTDAQLDTPYREGGWTVRELAHHVPDSHLNMYVRLKLALTEDSPTIKPYDQDAWSKLADTQIVPVATSLQLMEAVQERAVAVLRATTPADRERTLMHPENGLMRIDQLAALYAWHGDHHIAHIQNLRTRMGW